MKRTVLAIIMAISLQSVNGQMQQQAVGGQKHQLTDEQIHQATDEQIQQAIERISVEYDMMGLSVIAVCDGKIAGEWYAGLRDYERNLPVNKNTKYRIASISKFVMTTAMMKLCDQKRLDLDEDAGNYLGFPLRNPNHPETPITVRMLLLHTSSINEGTGYDEFLMATYNNVGAPPSFSELLVPGGRYYTDNMWRKEGPGEYYTYCNANFGLAGTIIERITGQSFETFIQENLFIPMKITGSYISEGIADINNLAVIYRREDSRWMAQTDNYSGLMSAPRDFSGYVTGTNAAVFSPQGGLRISAAELARIMILHMNKGKYEGKRIISKRSIRLMHRAQFISTGTNSDNEGVRTGNRGLSVQILPESASGSILPIGSHFLGHSGSAYGLISDFYFDPKGKYGFIFITNGMGKAPEKGSSGSFYNFEEALIKALQENSAMPCK